MFQDSHSAANGLRSCRRREFLCGLAAISALATGCGSILYPERVGQPRGALDWKVVGLDTLGLLFFFVPGVIAFAVDFYNGTIYLPPEETPYTGTRLTLSRRVPLPAGQRNLSDVQEVVRREANVDVDLQPGKYLTRPLTDVSDAAMAAGELETEWLALQEKAAK